MSTIREVARRANVSIGTVSNVLRGSPSVTPAVRERVTQAIAELDYHPNQIARSLKTRQTHLLGMIIPDITNPFFPQMTRGAEDSAIQHGYLLVTANTDDQVEREKHVLSVLRNRRVDGLLLVVAPSDEEPDHIQRTIAAGIPIVCLDRVPAALSVSSVAADAVYGAEICVRHLIAMGHRSIAIITGDRKLQTASDRLAGYRHALVEAGIEENAALIVQGDFRAESGYLGTKELLLGRDQPTAIFVSNGMMGLGALRALKEIGRRCPEEIALAVFDEMPGNGGFYPEITTVVQPAYEIGYQGAEMLIRAIEGDEPKPAASIRLRPELRIRESTFRRVALAAG